MANFRELITLVLLGIAGTGRAESQVELSSEGIPDDYSCVHPPYKVYLFSQSPLIVYIENFITADERAHLQSVAHGNFKPSAILMSNGSTVVNSIRSSQSAVIKRDAIARCIEERALDFQGLDIPAANMELIQLVKYAPTEQYLFHTDWLKNEQISTSEGGNRISSFFGAVKTNNVTGGGTNFPVLEAPRDERWCHFIDCDQPYESGVTFRPIEGNVVYWRNLLEGGGGDWRTLHAGLPVVSGQKIGINIWTRQASVPASWR